MRKTATLHAPVKLIFSPSFLQLRGLVQDGFVDDLIKLERILRAMCNEGLVAVEVVEGALAGRTALPRSIGGGGWK